MSKQAPKSSFAVMKDLKPGDKLRADGGFTCLAEHEHVVVKRDNEYGEDNKNDLYVDCAGPFGGIGGDHGRPGMCKRDEKHFLDGQSSFEGADPDAYGPEELCVGFYKVGEML